MSEPLSCPHCRALLTDTEVIRLHRQYAAAQRKTHAGGHNGGRPPRYPERTNQQILDAARRHSNAVLQVGPESERQIVPIEEL